MGAGGERERALLTLWEAVMAGRVRLVPPMRERFQQVPERGHGLMCSQGDPDIPASTHRLEVGFGRFKSRARLARGFGTETRALNFVRLMTHAMTRGRRTELAARTVPMTVWNQYQRD